MTVTHGVSGDCHVLYLLNASDDLADLLDLCLPGEKLEGQCIHRVGEGQRQVVLIPFQVLHTPERGKGLGFRQKSGSRIQETRLWGACVNTDWRVKKVDHTVDAFPPGGVSICRKVLANTTTRNYS